MKTFIVMSLMIILPIVIGNLWFIHRNRFGRFK